MTCVNDLELLGMVSKYTYIFFDVLFKLFNMIMIMVVISLIFSYDVHDVMAFMIKKKLAHIKRAKVVFKPLYIVRKTDGEFMIFSVPIGSAKQHYYVCIACKRGFINFEGLDTHQLRSESHERAVDTLSSCVSVLAKLYCSS